MLTQLTIRDFAIIDRLSIDWSPGLNAVTGETGAGKSIIIDAVGALLGGRVSPDLVRSGATRALVEGVFALSEAPDDGDLRATLDEYGLEPEDGALILTREVAVAGGRGGARINGRAVPASVLQQVGEHLVDIHGQSEHLSLLRPREHLELLDRYAELGAERRRLAGLVAELREVEREQGRVREEARQAAREQDLLRHEVDQIEAAGLAPDEEDELQLVRGRLRNVERLRSAVAAAYAALSGGPALADGDGLTGDEGPGATGLLAQAAAACSGVASVDPALEREAEALAGTAAQAEESARALRGYLDAIEDDPQQLQEVEERLLLIADLKRKFGETIGDVLAYAERARARLDAVERQDQLLGELEARRADLRRAVGTLAAEISARRSEAATRLRRSVEAELADLNMGGTRFVVRLARSHDPNGVPLPTNGSAKGGPSDGGSADGGSANGAADDPPTFTFDATGVDRVEFLIAPNPGEEPKGLGRIASGGELARVSLALKAILSQVDRRATLIFDEVDVGVGGRSAPVVGQKLWGLTADGGHQVLCVTHMPQVAAYADAHLVVAKGGGADTTRVVVRQLAPDERVDELALMLGGAPGSAGARRNAEELLDRATARKEPKAAPTTGST